MSPTMPFLPCALKTRAVFCPSSAPRIGILFSLLSFFLSLRACVYVYVCMCLCMYVCMFVCGSVCVYVYVYVFVCMCMCLSTCLYVSMYACLYACLNGMCVCMYIYVQHIHVYLCMCESLVSHVALRVDIFSLERFFGGVSCSGLNVCVCVCVYVCMYVCVCVCVCLDVQWSCWSWIWTNLLAITPPLSMCILPSMFLWACTLGCCIGHSCCFFHFF